jgi:hypothetical protein
LCLGRERERATLKPNELYLSCIAWLVSSLLLV